MNFKSAVLTISLLSSAFSLQSANHSTSIRDQSTQTNLSPEDEKALDQIIQQMIAIIATYMMENQLTLAICNGLVYQIENDEFFISDGSHLSASEINNIPDISNEIFEELTSIINSISIS